MIRAESTDLDRLVADLRSHPQRKTGLKALRRALRQPLPAARRVVKASALATLPSTGGLGAWVAASRVGASVRVAGDSVTLTVRAGRSSRTGKRSDIRAIDKGRVRAPAWGNRRAWHRQSVPPGFFTAAVDGMPQWEQVGGQAAAAVVEELTRG